MNGILLALVSALLFGASTPASKLLLADLSPFQLAGLLYLGAALGMAPLSVMSRRREPRARLDLANRRRLAGAVVLGGIAGPVLLLMGLQLASAASVSLILNLEMAATAALGVAVFREPLARAGWLGVAGIVGAGILISSGGGWPGFAAGLWVAAGCLCWGLDNHLTARIDGITPERSTLWKGVAAGSVNLAIGVVLAPLTLSPATLAAALCVGALSYGVSISLYIASAQQLGATRAQGLFALAPFFGASLSLLILGEALSRQQQIAGGILLVSVAALLFSRHSHEHRHEAIEHIHSHRHDDGHHDHPHPEFEPDRRHTHWHRHEPVVHSHPHWPDLHHRHEH